MFVTISGVLPLYIPDAIVLKLNIPRIDKFVDE